MNVVQVTSGLGNQLFQYAFGLAVGAVYDISWFEGPFGPNSVAREYGLDQFLCRVPVISRAEIAGKLRCPKWKRFLGGRPELETVREEGMGFHPEFLSRTASNFVGYFQCEKYFLSLRGRLQEEIRLRDPEPGFLELAERIRGENAVSVHIRRGDYLAVPELGGVCDRGYYRRAMDYVRGRAESPKFWFFSDDIAWVREEFRDVPDARFVDGGWKRAACDMMLMRECRHHVIANSSYSWWGAWLGGAEDGMTVAPGRWFADGRHTDIVPERWVRL